MENKLNTFVVMGGTHRAVLTLKEILKLKDVNIQFAIFQEDYPWDEQWLPDLKNLAEKNNISYHIYRSGEKIRPDTLECVKKLYSRAIIGIGIWRSILPASFWKNTKYGYIGLHGTLLPEYSGFAGINWYVINGEKECGLQMIQLDENIDGGKLVSKKDGTPFRKIISLDIKKTMREIMNEVEKNHVNLIIELIKSIKNDDISFSKQDESKTTWTCHRGPDDGEIDWTKTSIEIHNFIRAQSHPYPGAFSYYKNKKFHIWKSIILKNPKKYVGRILGKVVTRNKEYVEILTGDSLLRITDFSVDGKKVIPNEFIDSVREKLGFDASKAIIELERRISEIEKNKR